MIKTKDDYDFINFVSDIIVDGGILPKRPALQRNLLRGEDPAFLLEGIQERKSAYSNIVADTLDMDNIIRGDRLQYITNSMIEFVDEKKYIKPLTETESKFEQPNMNVASMYNLEYQLSDIVSKPENFDRDMPLRLTDMINLFVDIDKLRTYTVDSLNRINDISCTHTYIHQEQNEQPYYKQAGGHTLFYYAQNCYTDGDNRYGAMIKEEVNGGNLSIDIGQTRAKYSQVSKVVLFCDYTETIYNNITGERTYKRPSGYQSIVVDGYIDGSIVKIIPSSIKQMVKNVLNHYNFVETWGSLNDGYQTCDLELLGIVPIFNLGQHTKYQ